MMVRSVLGIALVAVLVGVGVWFSRGTSSLEYWVEQVRPIPATVAGHEAFLGIARGRWWGDNLYVVAIDDHKVSVLWKVGPLGTYRQGYRYTRVAVAGRLVAVTDYQSKLRIYALDTGKPVRTLSLSDRPSGLCSENDGHSVWVSVVDKHNVRVDLGSGKTTPAPKPPPNCNSEEASMMREKEAMLAQMRKDEELEKERMMGKKPKPTKPASQVHVVKPPQVPDFKSSFVLHSPSVTVEAGVKNPGTAIPEAVGYAPKTGKLLWHVTVPSIPPSQVNPSTINVGKHYALGGGRLFAAYKTNNDKLHLTAFDAHTGKRLWDHTMSGDETQISQMVGLKSAVVVARFLGLGVYNASNGDNLGTIGR